MINKILTYFPNSVTQDFPPDERFSGYYWFKEKAEDPLWIGIPAADLTASQLELLQNLFYQSEIDTFSTRSADAEAWHQFLFQKGEAPKVDSDDVRFIQFSLRQDGQDRNEISEALQGFFPDHVLLWLSNSSGVLIEEKAEVQTGSEEYESIAATFESDFFIKLIFYIGKYQKITGQLPEFYEKEKQLFRLAVQLSARDNVFTFEKVFPKLLASSMPESLKGILEDSIIEAFRNDRELMTTIKVFLESNSNASLAAKKLYLHRNTLQYRLDKFIERTGIQLKDFDSAVMVYVAAIYEELN